MPHPIDWGRVASVLNNWQLVSGSILATVALIFRSRIVRYWRGVFNAFGNAKKSFDANKALEEKLRESNKRGDDFKAILEDYKQRYEDFKIEFEAQRTAGEERLRLLGEELEDIRHKMETTEDILRLVVGDRDSLYDYSRGLIGQLFTLGKTPASDYPKLQSFVAVPSPRTTEPPKNA